LPSRFRSPSTSLIVQGLLAAALLLFSGRFQALFELAIFAEWLIYMLAASTVFVFRRRAEEAPSPYRMPGYPLVPALFVLAAGAVLIYTYASNLRNSLAGTALILTGVPLYLWIRARPRG